VLRTCNNFQTTISRRIFGTKAQVATIRQPLQYVLIVDCRFIRRIAASIKVDMAYLVIAARGREPIRQAISGESVTIGRALTCKIWMDDAKLSREHCRLERINNAWILSDLGSTNGTWLDGRQIDRERIGDGESFEAGDTRFVFHAGQLVAHNRPRDPHDAEHRARMNGVNPLEETLPVQPSKLNGRPTPVPKPVRD